MAWSLIKGSPSVHFWYECLGTAPQPWTLEAQDDITARGHRPSSSPVRQLLSVQLPLGHPQVVPFVTGSIDDSGKAPSCF